MIIKCLICQTIFAAIVLSKICFKTIQAKLDGSAEEVERLRIEGEQHIMKLNDTIQNKELQVSDLLKKFQNERNFDNGKPEPNDFKDFDNMEGGLVDVKKQLSFAAKKIKVCTIHNDKHICSMQARFMVSEYGITMSFFNFSRIAQNVPRSFIKNLTTLRSNYLQYLKPSVLLRAHHMEVFCHCNIWPWVAIKQGDRWMISPML